MSHQQEISEGFGIEPHLERFREDGDKGDEGASGG
jgi:hypothetical protein